MYPGGTPYGGVSNLNYGKQQIRANSAIVPLGNDGSVEVKTSVCGADVIVDVTGGFVPTSTPLSSGRFVPVGPSRILDTRQSGSFPIPANSQVNVTPERLEVPDSAIAVAVNITVTNSGSAGFVTAFPGGTSNPGSSMLNTDGKNQVRAALAIVPMSTTGIEIYKSFSGHLTVDIVGYFTGATDPVAVAGLFVPSAPTRVLDLRSSPLDEDQSTVVVGVPSNVSAVASNVTIVGSQGSGFLAAYPNGGSRNGTSTVNAANDRDVVANLAITSAGMGVNIIAGSSSSAAILDYAGYFV